MVPHFPIFTETFPHGKKIMVYISQTLLRDFIFTFYLHSRSFALYCPLVNRIAHLISAQHLIQSRYLLN